MKLNPNKVGTMYSAFIDGDTYKYGWYESGKAFIAKNGDVLTFKEAYGKLVPKCNYNLSDAFFVGADQYSKTIGGIVRYLIEKHNSE